ncbi:MAG: hypothetical protein M1835_002523, partial [Candelina submexicana]
GFYGPINILSTLVRSTIPILLLLLLLLLHQASSSGPEAAKAAAPQERSSTTKVSQPEAGAGTSDNQRDRMVAEGRASGIHRGGSFWDQWAQFKRFAYRDMLQENKKYPALSGRDKRAILVAGGHKEIIHIPRVELKRLGKLPRTGPFYLPRAAPSLDLGSCSIASCQLLDAFQISITHSDQARASVFAQRAYESRVICEGQDNPETRKIKRCIENPGEHLNFGASTR